MLPGVGVVSVDVEPDNVWKHGNSHSMENIGRLPAFHALCVEFGIKPTYLVTWSVASDDNSAKVLEKLLESGDCEIGLHPHLWETPPITEADAVGSSIVVSSYPDDVLEEKLTNLWHLLKSRYEAPLSHRAGRWAIESRQVALLGKLGVRLDTSVTPGIDWSGTAAPDFTDAPLRPYELSTEDLLTPGSSGVIEFPCTVKPGWRVPGMRRRGYIRSLIRLSGGAPEWLRVSPAATPAQLEKLCAWGLAEIGYLNLMTHSSEFLLGGSPYWTSQAQIDSQMAMFGTIFRWWNRHSVTAATLCQFTKSFRDAREGA